MTYNITRGTTVGKKKKSILQLQSIQPVMTLLHASLHLLINNSEGVRANEGNQKG